VRRHAEMAELSNLIGGVRDLSPVSRPLKEAAVVPTRYQNDAPQADLDEDALVKADLDARSGSGAKRPFIRKRDIVVDNE
jgi:hypothetical protein